MRLTPAILWGPRKDRDYWAALRAGMVEKAEQRAVALLRSLSDERRFSIYALTGKFVAMGDVTKHLYVLEHHGGVIEHDDMGPCATWCIAAENRYLTPETDNVVTLKTLIEGEEMYFRRIGNRSLIGIDQGNSQGSKARWPVVTPYEQRSFLRFGLFESAAIFVWLTPLTEGIAQDPEELEQLRNHVVSKWDWRVQRVLDDAFPARRRRRRSRYRRHEWLTYRVEEAIRQRLEQECEASNYRVWMANAPVYAMR